MGLTYWWDSSVWPPDTAKNLPEHLEQSPVGFLRFKSMKDDTVHVLLQEGEYLDLIYPLCGAVFNILKISDVKTVKQIEDLDDSKFCISCGVKAEYKFWTAS